MSGPTYRKIIDPNPDGPKTIPLNQAVQVGNTIYVSGQLGLKDGKLIAEDIESQTRQALVNIKSILDRAGSGMDRVVKCMVLLKDMNEFAKMNTIYAQAFSHHQPARMCYQVARLPMDGLVEIDAVAIAGDVIDIPNKL